MPLTLKAINAELAKRGHIARLEKAGPYFYFFGVRAPTGWTELSKYPPHHDTAADVGIFWRASKPTPQLCCVYEADSTRTCVRRLRAARPR